ncbi:MAG: transcriptional repressor [Candidatus Lambdaproteobacteria bacterium]|nr:transcriptional repressor [Candidatus Lambdaproteobacteria bacterium]
MSAKSSRTLPRPPGAADDVGASARVRLSQEARQNPEKAIFLDFLERRNLKLTRQREAVINEVFSDQGHFEADEIVHTLRSSKPRVSRATVYRTLELLQECQLVEKLDFGTSQSYYEHVQAGEHHDHLICTRCGNVIEFHDDGLEAQQAQICRNFGFQDTHHSLRIFGICSKCRQLTG